MWRGFSRSCCSSLPGGRRWIALTVAAATALTGAATSSITTAAATISAAASAVSAATATSTVSATAAATAAVGGWVYGSFGAFVLYGGTAVLMAVLLVAAWHLGDELR